MSSCALRACTCTGLSVLCFSLKVDGGQLHSVQLHSVQCCKHTCKCACYEIRGEMLITPMQLACCIQPVRYACAYSVRAVQLMLKQTRHFLVPLQVPMRLGHTHICLKQGLPRAAMCSDLMRPLSEWQVPQRAWYKKLP